MPLTEAQKTRAAADMADARIGFFIHFAIYLAVNAILITINYREGGEWWAQWPALGWGAGVIGHAIGVFGRMPRALVAWRQRRIERLRDEIR